MTTLPLRLASNPSCTECELHEHIKSVYVPTVRYPESLDSGNTAIVFIGQNPGWHEDQQNEPFVGKSGELVKKVYIGGCNLQEKATIFLTNIVRCHTINNETPKNRHTAACHFHTMKDLWAIRDMGFNRVIYVTLGAPATSGFYRHFVGGGNWEHGGWVFRKRVSPSLTESFNYNGSCKINDNVPPGEPSKVSYIFSTYHPAAVLRNNNYINAVSAHMQLVSDCLDGVMASPSLPLIIPNRSPRCLS